MCGLQTWGRHLQAGLRALGHDCDIVSLTWSGRPRQAWGSERPGTMWYRDPVNATGKYRQSADFFRQYDGIILSELEIGLQDREAKKHGWSMPRYARALELSGVPFTAALQGFDYSEANAPFAGTACSLPNFTGTAVAHSSPAKVLNGNPVLERLTWLEAPLPYQVADPGDTALPPRDTAGMAGRFCHIKGCHLLAIMAGMGLLPDGTIVKLSGTAAISNRPSVTVEVMEVLEQEFGFRGRRQEGNIYTSMPWSVSSEEKLCGVDYTGSYTDPVAVSREFAVAVALTSRKNSSGTINYALLEAVNAGCLLVSTATQWRPSFWGWVLEPLDTMPSIRKTLTEESVKAWLRQAAGLVGAALGANDAVRREMTTRNLSVLQAEHSPAAVAQKYVQALS
jgi:hypothetical protein